MSKRLNFIVNNMPYCICLGKYGENEDIAIKIIDDGVLGTPLFAFMSEDDQQDFVAYMSGKMAHDFEICETGVKGSVLSDFTNGGAVLFTYPYAVGLNILVDDKVSDYNLYKGVFPIVSISEGMHTVELKYTIPEIGLGLSVSTAFIVVLLIVEIICLKRKKTV